MKNILILITIAIILAGVSFWSYSYVLLNNAQDRSSQLGQDYYLLLDPDDTSTTEYRQIIEGGISEIKLEESSPGIYNITIILEKIGYTQEIYLTYHDINKYPVYLRDCSVENTCSTQSQILATHEEIIDETENMSVINYPQLLPENIQIGDKITLFRAQKLELEVGGISFQDQLIISRND